MTCKDKQGERDPQFDSGFLEVCLALTAIAAAIVFATEKFPLYTRLIGSIAVALSLSAGLVSMGASMDFPVYRDFPRVTSYLLLLFAWISLSVLFILFFFSQ